MYNYVLTLIQLDDPNTLLYSQKFRVPLGDGTSSFDPYWKVGEEQHLLQTHYIILQAGFQWG